MAGVGCCRRRRVRPAVQYLLVAFCLFNFCLAAVFFQRIYGDRPPAIVASENDSDQAALITNKPPQQALAINEGADDNHHDYLHEEEEEEKGDKNDFPDYEVSAKKGDETTFPATSARSRIASSLTKAPKKSSNKIVTSSISSSSSISKAFAVSTEHQLLANVSGSTDYKLLNIYEPRAKQPAVLNWNLVKNVGSNVNVIVAVQIHDRAAYLAYLFDSFRHVRDWNGTVIVLSHDFYSEEIDSLVQNCTFAPIIDIYFPVPNQIFKNRFPGEDPRDCKRDMNPESAKKQGCYNANYPDTYGHYREARFSQTKHHWIWKLHYIFDEVIPKHIPNFGNGQVLLLEEDHYVSPDFLHVLRLAARMASGNQRIVTLGNYKDMRFGEDAHRFAVNKWVSSRLNMGMSLTADTWKLIQGCVKTFCDFDDYNWDWSLQFTSIQCIEGNLHTLYARSSRIFHIGECAGIHFKNKCIASEKVESIKKMLSENSASLFPTALQIDDGVAAISQLRPKANGGWGDPRDRVLCRALASGSYINILKSVDRAQWIDIMTD